MPRKQGPEARRHAIPDPAAELQQGIIRFQHAGKLLARVSLGGGERSLLEQWGTDMEGRAAAQEIALPGFARRPEQAAPDRDRVSLRSGPSTSRPALGCME